MTEPLQAEPPRASCPVRIHALGHSFHTLRRPRPSRKQECHGVDEEEQHGRRPHGGQRGDRRQGAEERSCRRHGDAAATQANQSGAEAAAAAKQQAQGASELASAVESIASLADELQSAA
jgi:hypothetical protein